MNALIWPRILFAALIVVLVVALYLVRTTPNGLVGIRTPHTLASPLVWAQTHTWASFWFNILAVPLLIVIFTLSKRWLAPVCVINLLLLCGVALYKSEQIYSKWNNGQSHTQPSRGN